MTFESDYSRGREKGVSEEIEDLGGTVAPLDKLSDLKRENDLLRLEARYDDRIKKQYLHRKSGLEISLTTDIERLHKHSLRFDSDEAEIHSFVRPLS